MVSSLKFYLNILFVASIFLSCSPEEEWYKRELNSSQQMIWADRFFNGSGKYYQGTVPEQLLLAEAAQMDPENSKVLREQGVAWLKRGFGIQMHDHFEKAIKVDPVAWQGYRGYNYLYFYRDYERALADFNALDTLTSDTDYPQGQSVDYMRGLCYLGLNNYGKSIEYFTKYINEVTAEDGESWVDVYAFLYRGIVYAKLGDFKNARIDFEKGIKYYKDLADFYYHLAALDIVENNKSSAIKNVEIALDLYEKGYYHQRSYVTVQEQLHSNLINLLKDQINQTP